jgi:hypothetical protein
MYNVYSIIISKRGKKTPQVGEFLKNIFKVTWGQVVTRHNEVWLVGREKPANIDDLTPAIKGLSKNIDGVIVSNIAIVEACWDKNGAFDEDYVNDKCPGTREALRMLQNKEI